MSQGEGERQLAEEMPVATRPPTDMVLVVLRPGRARQGGRAEGGIFRLSLPLVLIKARASFRAVAGSKHLGSTTWGGVGDHEGEGQRKCLKERVLALVAFRTCSYAQPCQDSALL